MKLTNKEERFCRCVAEGMTGSEAYRNVYDVSNSTDTTIWTNSSKLSKKANIQARIKEIREEMQKAVTWTREMSVKALLTAFKEGTPQVKVSAVREINAMYGYNHAQQIEITSSGDMSATRDLVVDILKNKHKNANT